jgi:hypothetical protein
MIQKLYRSGAKMDILDSNGKNLIEIAMESSDVDMLETVLSWDDPFIYTALTVVKDHVSLMRRLINVKSK